MTTAPPAVPDSPADPHAALRAQVATLANARVTAEAAVARVRAAKAAWETEHKVELDVAAAATKLRDDIEAAVRAAALALYKADPTAKKPVPGLEVKDGTVLEYDAGEALKWAKQTGLALELNTKAFEAIASASDDLPFVKKVPDPKCSIARNLEGAGYDSTKA